MIDLRDLFVEWFDYYAARATERLVGLTDAEYLWEPVPGCWTVRPLAGGGGFALDGFARDGGGPEPDPPPVTTIAWRLVHLAIGSFDHPLRPAAFGVERSPVAAGDIPGTAADALAFFERGCATWRADLLSLTEARIAQPLGADAGPYADDPIASYVEHMHDEFIHHTAEIALLRDLYRAQS
jgi:DinB superfamily